MRSTALYAGMTCTLLLLGVLVLATPKPKPEREPVPVPAAGAPEEEAMRRSRIELRTGIERSAFRPAPRTTVAPMEGPRARLPVELDSGRMPGDGWLDAITREQRALDRRGESE